MEVLVLPDVPISACKLFRPANLNWFFSTTNYQLGTICMSNCVLNLTLTQSRRIKITK